MRLLWLTLADPDPPENGQFLYSSGLIHGVASAGATLQVIGLARPGGAHRDGEQSGTVRWSLAAHRPRPGWASLPSPLPVLAHRPLTAALRRRIEDAARDRHWDAIVFDSIALAGALAPILASAGEGPCRIVYVAHNFEEGVARRIAEDEPQSVKRLVRSLDAAKVMRLERSLVRAAHLVTANTPEDQARYRALSPGGPVLFLPPAYRGHDVPARTISSTTPRRAVIVGSYDWPPKRASLEAFLAAADGPFLKAAIELVLVGNAEESFLVELRRRFAWVTCTGRVEDVAPHLTQARIALVPDLLGGFKLKGLDYVYNRVPIFGIDGAVPGMPLRQGDSMLLFADHRRLAEGVIEAIDDFDRLNRLQERAYAACRGLFDETELGLQLLAAIAAVDRTQASSAAAARLQM